MGSSSRAGFQLSSSDSSDTEELPVINFSQSRKAQENPKVVLDDSDSEIGRPVTSWTRHPLSAAGKHDVLMVSSESEEEEAFIPLSVRLKQKQMDRPHESQTSLTDHDRNRMEGPSPAFASSHHIPEVKPPGFPGKYSDNISHQSGDYATACVWKDPPLRGESLQKGKRTPAEIQAAQEEALRRRAEREKQQGERERLRAEKKAQADAVKAMRPDECLKHMIVTVDPGRWSCCSGILWSTGASASDSENRGNCTNTQSQRDTGIRTI